MAEKFADILTAGGKSNSLGRASEVIDIVLHDQSRIEELYKCMFDDDAWVRMRAADAFEKVCRQHPDWIEPYIDRLLAELNPSKQPSIQWHLAQIYRQIDLDEEQKWLAIDWLKQLISVVEVDWITSANAMDTLMQFTKDGSLPRSEMIALLKVQQHHKSKAVVRRADKLLAELSAS